MVMTLVGFKMLYGNTLTRLPIWILDSGVIKPPINTCSMTMESSSISNSPVRTATSVWISTRFPSFNFRTSRKLRGEIRCRPRFQWIRYG